MPQYYYTAKSKEREGDVTDIAKAESKKKLADKLREEGLFLIEAEEVKKEGGFFFGGISLQDKIFFLRNLRMMLSGGLSLSRSLRTIAKQIKNEKLRSILLAVREDIQKGETLSQAMGKYPDEFSKMFINVLRLSEETGKLEENLGILINQFEKEDQLKSEVKGALVYPAVIAVAMIVVGIVMLIFVVPMLSDTFESMGAELPITTRFFIGLGEFLAAYWFLIPLILISIFFSLKFTLKTSKGKYIFDTMVLKVPIVSRVVKKINSARAARTLNSMLSSGISIIKSLDIIAESMANVHFKEALNSSAESIKKGSKLSEALNPHSHLFSFLMIQMIEVGEETGNTSEVLEKTADFLEEEVFSAMKNLTSVIEPALMIVVGVAVGFFAFSMLTPIYSIMDML